MVWLILLQNLGNAGSPGTPGSIDPTLLAALRTYLLSVPGLSSLTGVYNVVSPANALPPFVILNPVGESPVWNNSGVDYFAWSDVQVTIVTQDDDVQGVQLRDSAFTALTPKSSNPSLAFTDGQTDRCLPGRTWQFHQPGTGPEGGTVWLTAFMARFLVTRQM